MKKIALINQRYGLEVNGGSELYTRQIAEKLTPFYDVNVLTTCALDYTSWDNYYPSGVEMLNGVKVHRFKTARSRISKTFDKLNEEMCASKSIDKSFSEKWIDEMGPYSPELVEYCRQHSDEYAAFIVVTYLYYTAVRCLPYVANKAIFVPTAHNEPYIDFPIYRKVFENARSFVFLTEEEHRLVNEKFSVKGKPFDVMGVGIEIPKGISANDFKNKHNLDSDYLVYVGRVDVGKCCPEMFKYFSEYKKRNPSNLKLVVMGKAVIDIPKNNDIIYLGFVKDEEKFNGISGAKALLLPSEYESLSISVLESMALSIPVIVNGRCSVLRKHCVTSNGGLYYKNYFEFEGTVNYLLNCADYAKFKENCLEYVNNNYKWDVIVEKWKKMIEEVV